MKCYTRLVKTTISHLDLLIIMYFIDHSGSTYWHKKDSEKVKILSQNRTLSDISKRPSTRNTRCRYTTKVEELEQLNQSMRDRDKMKDDAIAHLSDLLVSPL